jgi:glycerol-3-phosphate dehydrogenase
MSNAGAGPMILVLGAGINGCAIARELLLNGVGVAVVDRGDIAGGTTARSSRLLHGGLRYLEYGELDLVRESLRERDRLIRLAAPYVRPLRFYIPIRSRWRGWLSAASRLLGGELAPTADRGLWLVRLGLRMYHAFCADSSLPGPRVDPVGEAGAPRVDARQFRWLCSYSDCQIPYPERFVLALLEDARQIAENTGSPFALFTYHRATRSGRTVVVESVERPSEVAFQCEPALVINATGPWGDWTLGELGVPSPRLFGGTKGSHVVTTNRRLVDDLGGGAVYVQADDGRMVFVLPFGETVLIGTTDEPFFERPECAVATTEEIEYLIATTNRVFPRAGLTCDDVLLHMSGVRPLPATGKRTPASITRRHHLEFNLNSDVAVVTVVGGKLTTCRALAQEVATVVCRRLGRAPTADSRDRVLPGGEGVPVDPEAQLQACRALADGFALRFDSVAAMWSLVGSRTQRFLETAGQLADGCLDGTSIPIEFVRWVIRREWVHTLDDLVERRLMLLYHPTLTGRCLAQLAGLLADAGKAPGAEASEAVRRTRERLARLYGRVIPDCREATAGRPADQRDG